MGLFDNLFLDKNTPMAINTGDSKLSGIPTAVSDAQTGGGTAGSGGGAGNPQGGSTPGGGTPQTGGTSQAVQQLTQIQNINPLPSGGMVMADAPISGGSGVAQGQSITTANGDSTMSFDIGGDMIFGDASGVNTDTLGDTATSTKPNNILGNTNGGLIQEGSPSTDANTIFVVSGLPEGNDAFSGIQVISPETPLVSMPLEGTISSPIVLESTLISDPISILTESVAGVAPPLAEVPKIELQASSVISTESPLMNLVSGFDTTPTNTAISPPSPETPITNSPIMTTPTPPVEDAITIAPQPTDALFSLMETANGVIPTPIPTPLVEEEKIEVKSETITKITPITPLVTDTECIPQSTQENSPIDSRADTIEPLLEEQSPAMASVGKELARMTRSPRLQGKLIGFISGLEELSNEEEVLKNEKRKQIESYMTRISELKTEYETRIHALELEMENLSEQITTMDEEREHITQVIDGFKRELEVV